jgi:hypothetical protein
MGMMMMQLVVESVNKAFLHKDHNGVTPDRVVYHGSSSTGATRKSQTEHCPLRESIRESLIHFCILDYT